MGHQLAQRVQQPHGPAAPGTTTPPARRTVEEQIGAMHEQFGMAMPAGADPDQLVRDAITCLRQTPRLAQCEPATVLGGLMTCAQLGLRPGVLGHAWLIPFRNKETGAQQAQLVIGYQGYVDLIYRTGMVAGIDAQTIYERDTYYVQRGTAPRIDHVPDLSGKPGAPLAYYAVVHLTNGGTPFRVIPHLTMCEHRDTYALSKGGPWRTDFESMAHKTCLRQLAKWLPKNTAFGLAVAADSTVRTDLTPDAVAHGSHPSTTAAPEDTGVDDAEVVEPDPTGQDAEAGAED